MSDLPLLTNAERHQLLVEWNQTQVDYPRDRCLHELIEEQVARAPEATAVSFEDKELTYRQLNERANQLARYLQGLGVGADTLVAICMERSLEMVVGLLGILKAGGAYVPLDPEYPKERLAFMLEDAGVPVLLTHAPVAALLPAHSCRIVRLDADWPRIAGESVGNATSSVRAEHLAYMIYTSGSTGRPKGAMNTHVAIVNRLLWMQDAYRLTPSDRILQKTPFSFDFSVCEFFWPLLTGARVVMALPGGHKDGAYLAKLIRKEKITTIHFVPSMLSAFLEQGGLESSCASLKRVFCGGEALPFELQQRFFSLLPAELHNLYGPTEAAVDVTYWACERESRRRTVPIGRPIANTQIYILDRHLQPKPVGVPGELHIGGIGLARGYHNRPELTAEKFIPDPFRKEAGARLYKTGDLARYLSDGAIEYLGRLDHQVKIRGFRIELGEIESVLVGHPGVREAVVVVRGVTPEDKRLVAYVAGRNGTVAPSELRTFLRQKLPDYMIPAAFVMLDRLPRTPNDKVDRGLCLGRTSNRSRLCSCRPPRRRSRPWRKSGAKFLESAKWGSTTLSSSWAVIRYWRRERPRVRARHSRWTCRCARSLSILLLPVLLDRSTLSFGLESRSTKLLRARLRSWWRGRYDTRSTADVAPPKRSPDLEGRGRVAVPGRR